MTNAKRLYEGLDTNERCKFYSSALHKAVEIFLPNTERKVDDILSNGLWPVAVSAGLDRIIVFHISNGDTTVCGEKYRWDRIVDGTAPIDEALKKIPITTAVARWVSKMSDDSCISLRRSDFTDDEAAFLFANAFIRAEVEHDALTGIYNRRFFDNNMKRVISFLSRSESPLSMMMIDIDFFKRYNDTYGHLEGDKCLKTIAQTLSRSITRTNDFVVRYGGEEFIVVLPHTDEQGARLIADRLICNIRNCNIPHERNDAADCVTISIGVTTGKVTYMHNAEDFIKKADDLLYKSKQGGRNRYSLEQL